MSVLQSTLKLTLLDEVSARAKRIQGVLGGFQRQQTAFAAPLRGVMGQVLAFGGAYLGVTEGISGTIGAAMKFESAFADVRKVVDASDEQFQNMSRTIKSMSRELPLTSVEIAQLFAAAGESGVATNDLKAFAEMAARVGIAFDMSAGEAGESLAKLKTQLGLNVAETGDMADAINHLSNNMASKAKDITEYMLRVGSLAEMGGFAKEEIAAIGSAMIAAGAGAETAGTAMQNVVKAMTKGDFAKKGQLGVAKALGLHLPTIAKEMQKDAPKALKKVLTAIAKAPKDQHIALLSEFFGDEAKAFAPLIGNIGLLDQALDSVANKTNYSGSAFREYVARADTTANALQILRNKIAYVFEDIGEDWLPTIKEGVGEIGKVLDTLGERASIFDKLGASIQGFMHGLGYDGGVKDAIEGLGDLLFGEVDGDGSADKLGRIFKQFEGYGETIRQLKKDFEDNPIVKFLEDIGAQGFKLMLAAVGIGIVAGAIMKLGRAIAFLSGITTAIGLLKTVGKIGGILRGATAGAAGAGAGTGAAAGGIGAALATAGKGIGSFLKRNPWVMAGLVGYKALDAVPHDAMASATKDDPELPARLLAEHDRFGGVAFEGGRHRAGLGAGPTAGEDTVSRGTQQRPATIGTGASAIIDASRLEKALGAMPSGYQKDRPLTLDAATIGQLLQPTHGTQNVRVTNREPRPVVVNNTYNITEAASAQATAAEVMKHQGAAVKDAVEAADTDL